MEGPRPPGDSRVGAGYLLGGPPNLGGSEEGFDLGNAEDKSSRGPVEGRGSCGGVVLNPPAG
jgi:hypothetical protein